jgi:outer membrane immunogenic protein
MSSEVQMKKFLSAGIAATAFYGVAAFAADLPYKAPPTPVLAPSWAGFYLGLNGGWGWSNITDAETPFGVTGIGGILPQSLGTNLNGGVFGGQIGYNWQVQRWVFGVEGDFDAAGINGGSQVVFRDLLGGAGGTATDGFMTRDNINWLASIRGRVGMTWGSSLAYVTGGAAWESVKTTAMISTDTDPAIFSQSAIGSSTTTRAGYVVGGGYEWMIVPKWTVRGEYLFYGFGGGSTNAINIPFCTDLGGTGCGVNHTTGSNNISIVRLGVNYLFN